MNSNLGALEFNMIVETLYCLDGLIAGIADNFEALALVDHVLVQVGQEHVLVVLLFLAPVAHFDLSHHLFHQLVLHVPEQWLQKRRPWIAIEAVNRDPIELLDRIVIKVLCDVPLLNDVAIGALALLDALTFGAEG